jgi:hypothetical protein
MRKETHDWLQRAGVYKQHPHLKRLMTALQPDMMGRRVYPTALDADRQRTGAWFLAVFFIYDDVLEGNKETEMDKVMRAIMGELKHPEREPRSLVRAIAEVGNNFRHMPAPWKARFKRDMRKYYETLGLERDLLQEMGRTGQHPDLAGYLKWRWHNIGGLVVIMMVDYCVPSVQAAESWITHPLGLAVSDLFNWIFICQNDYTSARSGRDDGKLNLVWAFMREHGYSKDQACNAVMALHDAKVVALKNACTQLAQASDFDPAVLAWTESVVQAALGFARFHEDAKRYKQ